MQNSMIKENTSEVKSLVVKEQIEFCLTYIESLSPFLYETIKQNFSDYCNTFNSLNKKNRYMKNIFSNVKKISDIENKKIVVLNSSFKDSFYQNLKNIKNSNLVKKRLLGIMDTCSAISELLNELFLLYFSLDEKSKRCSKNVLDESIELPKLVVDLPKKNEGNGIVFGYKDNTENGLYLHITQNENGVVFSEKSFENEEKLFEKLLAGEDEKFDIEGFSFQKKNLSTFEKKRQNYIQYIYELEKNMYKLRLKDIDLTFPVNKLMEIANDILEIIYNNMVDSREYNGIENVIMYYTYKTYGADILLRKYDELLLTFNKKLDSSPSFIKKVIISELEENNVSVNKKILMSSSNILIALNKKIFRDFNSLLLRYYNCLEKIIFKVTKYMEIEEIIKLYKSVCSNIYVINKQLKIDIVKLYSNVQKVFVLVLYERLYPYKNKEFDIVIKICKEYLNEDFYIKNINLEVINNLKNEEYKLENMYNCYVYDKYSRKIAQWNSGNIFYRSD